MCGRICGQNYGGSCGSQKITKRQEILPRCNKKSMLTLISFLQLTTSQENVNATAIIAIESDILQYVSYDDIL